MIPYDYAAKGRADALAGLRDDKLYNLMEPHGEAYRNGHRLARLTKGTVAAAPARPEPIKATTEPGQTELF